ncbi:MAG: acyl-ACP--UDP-N-acetylglucosamine O-acyltransferase [bacterium]
MKIHQTAIIDKKAKLGKNVDIGPYVIIKENVEIGDNTVIDAHVYIEGKAKIGRNCHIYAGAVIGTAPQDVSYKGDQSSVIIGNDNIIREYVTIHRSKHKDGITSIGDENFFMGSVHIAHDCKIGNKVVIVNYSAATGHVTIEDKAFISGMVGIHQFVRIGAMAMIGGMSKVTQDIPPYVMVDGHPAKPYGLNKVGLVRNKISQNVRAELKKAYKILYGQNTAIDKSIDIIKKELDLSLPEIKHFVDFVESSKRGICK